jgi:hypothetical protein
MSMLGFEVTGPYVGALMMSLGALCVFIWAVLSGALNNADEVSQSFFEREMKNDRTADQRAHERDAS